MKGKKDKVSGRQMGMLQTELQRTGVGLGEVMDRYKISDPKNISPELYGKIMKALAKTKSVA